MENKYRNCTHRIPPYIKSLIKQVPRNILVPFTSAALYFRWIKLLDDNQLPHMTFHDLRYLNAPVMALLRIPDQYAQERGGWKSDKIMKRVYTQTFAEDRERVDDTIDEYFENILNGKEQKKKETHCRRSSHTSYKNLSKGGTDHRRINFSFVYQEVR